jgi:hypothetical protein
VRVPPKATAGNNFKACLFKRREATGLTAREKKKKNVKRKNKQKRYEKKPASLRFVYVYNKSDQQIR